MQTIVVAICLGLLAQVVAERLRLPAILPLLFVGIAAGPAGLRWFDPESMGAGLEVLIHLGVAIILLEGGLSLDLKQLRRFGGTVNSLLTVGVVVTWAGAAWLAHGLGGLDWPTAVLFGAILTVTGPTVIVPLLRHFIAPRRLKTVLLSEGLIIDPIGAVLAYLVLQWIGGSHMSVQDDALEIVRLAAAGTVLGFVGGSLARVVVTSRLVGRELRNLVVLALLMLTYLVSEGQAHQSGILAAVVMGVTLAAAEIPDIVELKNFKGQLTTLLISVLFVLLSGRLDVGAIRDLGWHGLAVALGIVFLVRPAAVLASVWSAKMGWRERLSLSMLAPRGIVAAAVASLSALSLTEKGLAGGSALEGLVYLSIVATCVWSTVMAIVLPRALGYVNDPERRRAVVVGSNSLTELLARLVRRTGRTTVVVDAVQWRLDRLRDEGFQTVCGDARAAASYEQAGVERDTVVFAATTNDELNLLAAELVHQEFGVEHPVVALQQPPPQLGTRSRAWVDLLGGRSVAVARWVKRLEQDEAVTLRIEAESSRLHQMTQDLQRRWPDDAVVLWWHRGTSLRTDWTSDPEEWEALTVLSTRGAPLDYLRRESGVGLFEIGFEESMPVVASQREEPAASGPVGAEVESGPTD